MRSVRYLLPAWSDVGLDAVIPGNSAHQFGPSLPSPPWRALYLDALFETDQQRMMSRIAEAKKALVLRARELFQTAGDHEKEQNAIEAAFQALCALEWCRLPPVGKH